MNRKQRNFNKLVSRQTYSIRTRNGAVIIKAIKYKVGDSVWIMLKDLIVRCNIIRVDLQYRKKHPCGIVFYDVDELIGHSLGEDDLFDSYQEAFDCCMDLYFSGEDSYDKSILDEISTGRELFDERFDSARFIKSTHLQGTNYGHRDLIEDDEAYEMINDYLDYKEHKVDWFTLNDLIVMKNEVRP